MNYYRLEDLPEAMSIEEFSKLVRVSQATAYSIIKNMNVETVQHFGTTKILKSTIIEILNDTKKYKEVKGVEKEF